MVSDDLPIPVEPAGVTAEWLSYALRQRHPGVEVTRVETLDQHSGTTGRMRIALEYASTEQAGPPTAFVKLPPFGETPRVLVGRTARGRREARFYAELAAEVPMRIPSVHYAAAGDTRGEYVMVLEDLAAADVRFATRLEPLDEVASGQIIEGLGRLHAHFWDDPRFDDELAWIPHAMRGTYGGKLVSKALEQFADDTPPVFTELCNLYVEHQARIAEALGRRHPHAGPR